MKAIINMHPIFVGMLVGIAVFFTAYGLYQDGKKRGLEMCKELKQ